MSTSMVWRLGIGAVVGLTLPALLLAQQPAPPEKVVAAKQAFQDSQIRLRQYEWIETTVVSYKGEQKSKKEERCYYGADGVLQKVPVGTPEQAKMPGGLRGVAAKNKKEKITEYMQQAVAMVKNYVPPNPALIQRSKDAGKASLNMIDPMKRIRLDFADYFQAGDVLSIEMDVVNNLILGVHVSTSLGSPEDPVSLDVAFGTLPDQTIYTSTIALAAPAKDVLVNIQNTGYKKIR